MPFSAMGLCLSALKREADAVRFIVGLSQFDNDLDLLGRLNDSSKRDLLLHALSIADSSTFYDTAFVPLLERVARDSLALGPRKRVVCSVLVAIFDAPIIVDSLIAAVREERVGNVLPVAWFALQLVCADDDALGARVRASVSIQALATVLNGRSLLRADDEQLRKACDELAVMLSTTPAPCQRVASRRDVTLGTLLDVPGGRHDNDFADFRRIAALPTMNEVLCGREPYLPLQTEPASIALTLDRQFRLNRSERFVRMSSSSFLTPFIF
jgi:hypothetical protein